MLSNRLPLLIAALALLLTLGAAQQPPIVKGVALLDWSHKGDLATLNAPHYYGWGAYCNGAANCLNMNRNWTLPQAVCYPTLLLGNEPTNPEPAGHPITPTLAASVTVSIQNACPAMRLVVANIHLNNGNGVGDKQWVADYLAAYQLKAGKPFTGTLGIHCYSGGGQRCLDRIGAVAAIYPGPLWVTEFGIYSPAELTKFLKGIAFVPRVERVYIWTNRDASDPNHFLDLVNTNGTLTALGQVYAAWQPPTVRRVWLPVTGDVMTGGGAYP